GRNALAVDGVQVSGKRDRFLAARKGDFQAPVVSWFEPHALAFAFDDDTHGDALHATGGQLRLDLLPQERRHRIAIQAVDEAARLPRCDQLQLGLRRRLAPLEARGLGDLVAPPSLDLPLRLQLLEQVPRNRLSLAVFIGREVEHRCVFDHRAELLEVLLLLGGHHVERLEVVLDVDAELGPFLALHAGRHFASRARQVADVTYAGFNAIVRTQVLADGARLGGRLDNHNGGACLLFRHTDAVGTGGLVRGGGNQLSRISGQGCVLLEREWGLAWSVLGAPWHRRQGVACHPVKSCEGRLAGRAGPTQAVSRARWVPGAKGR